MLLPARLAPLHKSLRRQGALSHSQLLLGEQARAFAVGRAVLAAAAASKVLLVESPAKAKKIQEFLGDDYKVVASYGHIRDLAQRAGAVLPERDYEMQWSMGARSLGPMQEITKAVKGAERLVLATDPDREGEAIAWHMAEVLKDKKLLEGVAVERITFTEVTQPAVEAALQQPRQLSLPLVDAYLARRALDYLFGFHLSPVLWKKIPVGAKSAGRVQSAALRMLCEREAAIEAFIPQKYFSVEAGVELPGGERVQARLTALDGAPSPRPGFASVQEAAGVAQRVRDATWAVGGVSSKAVSRNPPPPFTTSSLQQEANRRLGLSASRTMQLAQELYESGAITYMRTDGANMAEEAVEAVRAYLKSSLGEKYVPKSAKKYKAKAKNAQEAHEAIRPTDISATPKRLAGQGFSGRALKLYELIHNRTLACQAAPAKLKQVTADFVSEDGTLKLRAAATTATFDGFLAVYGDLPPSSASKPSPDAIPLDEGLGSQGGPSADGALEGAEGPGSAAEVAVGGRAAAAAALAVLRAGQIVALRDAEPAEHTTRPPGRYTEGGLVKAMEEAGIGRPSTYATIIKLLQERKYARREGRSLQPEPLGRVLSSFLESYFGPYVEYGFTAHMEQQLDEVAGGRAQWRGILSSFWQPFQQSTASLDDVAVREVIDALDASLGNHLFEVQQARQAQQAQQETLDASGAPAAAAPPAAAAGAAASNPRACPRCRSGRLGLKLSSKNKSAFIGCSNYPVCKHIVTLSSMVWGDEEVQEAADDFSSDEDREVEAAGAAKLQKVEGGEGRKGSSEREADESRVRAEVLGVRGNARHLGKHTESGKDVLVRTGLYGPYVQLGLDKEVGMRRVPLSKLATIRSVTLEKALDMLQLPRTLGRHPVSGEEVSVTSGKFGPFIKCGTVGRSVPQEFDPMLITLDEALELINQKASNKTRAVIHKGSAGAAQDPTAPGAPGRQSRGKASPASAAAGAAAAGGGAAGSSSGRGWKADSTSGQAAAAAPAAAEAEADVSAGSTVGRKRSGFQFFLSDRMGALKGMTYGERLRLLGSEWKQLPEDEREVYLQRSEEDKERRDMQRAGYLPKGVQWDELSSEKKQEWIEGWKGQQAPTDTADTVRRPTSAYTLFVKEQAARIRESKAEKSKGSANLVALADMWRNLPAGKRASYVKRAEEDKRRYQRERQEFIKTKRSAAKANAKKA